MRGRRGPGGGQVRRLGWIAAGICGVLLITVSLAAAQTGSELPAIPRASYEMPWWTVDGGGGTGSTGGGYELSGTAGQPDAGWVAGGGFTLGGGFLPGGEVVAIWHELYLPLVVR